MKSRGSRRMLSERSVKKVCIDRNSESVTHTIGLGHKPQHVHRRTAVVLQHQCSTVFVFVYGTVSISTWLTVRIYENAE